MGDQAPSQGKGWPGRGKCMCKGPEVGERVLCGGEIGEVCKAGAERKGCYQQGLLAAWSHCGLREESALLPQGLVGVLCVKSLMLELTEAWVDIHL